MSKNNSHTGIISLWQLILSVRTFAYRDKIGDVVDFSEDDYKDEIIDAGDSKITSKSKHELAYEKAWDARKFEIDNYWKRATYFWAFQIAAFAAYGLIISSTAYNSSPSKNAEILYCITCIGLVTAFAWTLTNIGSKFWQRHWEKHIDMLEDQITGPLYKVVYMYKTTSTYSVSKINEIVSRFFVIIWIVLGTKYLLVNISFKRPWGDVMYTEIAASIATVYFIVAMFKGYGRGHFGSQDFDFKKRIVFKKKELNA